MRQEFLRQAREALTELQRHCDSLENPADLEELEREWALVLHFSDQIYNKLIGAATTSAVEKQWLQEELRLRKDEPLYAYAKHARGKQHHGVERVTTRATGMVVFHPSPRETIAQRGEIVKLVPVTYRGVVYPVPDRWGDIKFTNTGVQAVGRWLELAMRALVQGAEHVDRTQRLEP